MTILQVENLSKSYGSGGTFTPALNDISFSLESGDFLAIVGASGSGKTTLLHTIAGVETPSSGRIFFEGKDMSKLSDSELAIVRRRNIGMIYQFFNLIPLLTVEENILLPQLLDNSKPDKLKLERVIKSIGLEGKADAYPHELSGGQQQRTAIGRALMCDPALVLADEPTGNLDSVNARTVVDLLKETNKKYGQTLVIVTHDESIALQADRIITMKDGCIARDERMRS